MKPLRLLLIRHGETVWNQLGRLQGHTNTSLTKEGMMQAKLLGWRLREFEVSKIYCSDLQRASHTASIIGQIIAKEVVEDERLRPRHVGVFQGETWESIQGRYPDLLKSYQSGNKDFELPGGGESLAHFENRMHSFFKELSDKNTPSKVLVISHGAVVGNMFRQVLRIPAHEPRRFRSRNTAINEFVFDRGNWYLEVFGDTTHLDKAVAKDDIDS